MQMRTQVTMIIAVAVIVWVAVLKLSGTTLEWGMMAPFGLTVSVVTALAVIFEKFAWKWPILNGWLVRRPPLAGTWQAELLSSYRDDDGNRVRKTVYVVIQQSLRTISVRMYTDKARSFSIAESIRSSEVDDLFDLAIVYQNVPEIGHRQDEDQSRIHFGALHLTDIRCESSTIEGPYWTDRKTNGHLTLMQRKDKIISSYREGVILFT